MRHYTEGRHDEEDGEEGPTDQCDADGPVWSLAALSDAFDALPALREAAATPMAVGSTGYFHFLIRHVL